MGGSSREVCLLRASQTDKQTHMVNGADNSQAQNLMLEASESPRARPTSMAPSGTR